MVLTDTSDSEDPMPHQPIILLRGLSREQAHWGDFLGLLQRAVANPVLALDLPGTGQALAETAPANLTYTVSQLRARLGEEHQRPLHLLAMSLGAMVAIEWATQYPAEVASLLLINGSAANLTPFYQRLKWQSYPLVAQALFASALKREQLILQLTANNPRLRHEQLAHWQHIAMERPVRKLDVLRQLLAASRFCLPAKPACPVLLVASRHDRLVDWHASQRIAELWQVPLLLHGTAGHDLALDDPKWLTLQAKHFYQPHG
ncbi:MAG: alpha/beta hydrolase [Gammaproteobacteria bacterium]|jgi:pimeloyl-ACP methyl ester carboxylesterase|nr:alpha/beta hydrolase [Gammaproteobacteria bacterium]MBU2279778.1 alpha/beta hydrolase [Gammaproteobacteria bacterium]MBU2427452.1 alpha/beta hydrolase [Gammaproteobacteria bacterium]